MSHQTPAPPISNLTTRLRDLYKHHKFTDCSFNVDHNIISGHKIILASASPVFEAMFYGPLAEKSCIEIPDITFDVFESMIKFIYTDEIDDCNIDDLIELYYCAEKYLINDLIIAILNRIKLILRYSNILQALDFSVCLNLKNLTNLCLNFFHNCCLNNEIFSKIFVKNNSNNYHVSKDCLNLILQEKAIEKNVNLVLFIKEWCRLECECLDLDSTECGNIKFILKDVEVPDNVLNEVISMNSLKISDFISINNNSNWMSCQRTYYKAVRPLVIGYNNADMHYATSISCDRFIRLKSISINSQLMPSHPYTLKKYTENLYIQIISTEDDTIVYDQKSIILNVEYNSMLEIIFDKSVVLVPDIAYSIKIIWDDSAVGSEYPRNIFSIKEKQTYCNFHFDANVLNLNAGHTDGSILNGVRYAIMSN